MRIKIIVTAGNKAKKDLLPEVLIWPPEAMPYKVSESYADDVGTEPLRADEAVRAVE